MEETLYGEDSLEQSLLARITTHYLQSTDFNGLPCTDLISFDFLSNGNLGAAIKRLVREGLITLEFGDRHENPFIKAYPAESVEAQLLKLDHAGSIFCLYPAPEHLAYFLSEQVLQDKPYSRELALGAAQLDYRAFSPSVLEDYRNDPRYVVDISGFGGRISIKNTFIDSINEYDSISLQSFGFARTKERAPAIAVYLRYLQRLSPEHQRRWHSKRVEESTSINRIYNLMSSGHWNELSLNDAILLELVEVNALCKMIGKPELFRNTFVEENRPRMFGLLLRPTQHEYEKEIQTLDKVLSDNVNLDFFAPEVLRESTEERPDGRIQVKQKGSLQMLEEWINLSYRGPSGQKYGRDIFGSLRTVRQERSKPSHAITEDKYDLAFFEKHRAVLEAVYYAVLTFRLILSKHPKARGYTAPTILDESNVSHVW